MTLLSIILINYNNSNDTINCLKQLMNQIFKDFEVIIVDNNSDYDSLILLDSFLEKIKGGKDFKLQIFYQGVNNGYAGGMNYGIKRSSGKIILIINSDIIIDEHFLKKAIWFFNKNLDYAIMGPKIYYFPNKKKIWSIGGYYRFFNHNGAIRIGRGKLDPNNRKFNKILEVDFISGCCMFVRREVFKKVKLLDKNYFMYLEDDDFCYRTRNSGFKIVYNPDILIYHKIDEIKEKFSQFVKYNFLKNKALFIVKFYPLIMIFYHLTLTFIIMFLSIFKNKTSADKIIKKIIKLMNAVIDGITLGFKLKIS